MNPTEQLREILLNVVNDGWFLRSKTDYPNGFTGSDVRDIIDKAFTDITALIRSQRNIEPDGDPEDGGYHCESCHMMIDFSGETCACIWISELFEGQPQ